MIWEGLVTGSERIDNFPEGEVQVHTDADVTVAFWFPDANKYGDEIAITAPGDFLGCGGNRGRITGTANVRILR